MRAIADGLLWTECADSWYGQFVAKVDQRLNRLVRRSRVLVGREAAVVKPDEPELPRPRLKMVKPVVSEPVWHPTAFVR